MPSTMAALQREERSDPSATWFARRPAGATLWAVWMLENADGKLSEVPWEGLALQRPRTLELAAVVFPRGASLILATGVRGAAVNGKWLFGSLPLHVSDTIALETHQPALLQVRHTEGARPSPWQAQARRAGVRERLTPRTFSDAEAMHVDLTQRLLNQPEPDDGFSRPPQPELATRRSWGERLEVESVKVWEFDTLTVIEQGRTFLVWEPRSQELSSPWQLDGQSDERRLRKTLSLAIGASPSPPSAEALLDLLELLTRSDELDLWKGDKRDAWGCVWDEEVLDRLRAGTVFNPGRAGVTPWPPDAVRAWHPPRVVDGCVELFLCEATYGQTARVRADPRGSVDITPGPRAGAHYLIMVDSR